MLAVFIIRDEFEQNGGAGGTTTLEPNRFYVYHDDGEFEEVSPATALRITADKVYVLLGKLPAATYDRNDIYLITRKESPAPPLD
jgi:hypothetical protein